MLIHWIWLASRPHMTDRAKAMLLQHFADPEDIFFADEASFSHIEGLTEADVNTLKDKDLAQAEQILESCARKKVHVMTYRDAAYPNRLKHIADPPLVLYYIGTMPDFDGNPTIGVVGTRKASGYGLASANRLGYELVRCGAVVVSGMASGIDAAAMQGALSAGGQVVAVLGCGVDVKYPAENRGLYADMERYGCILSEFPPETRPLRWHFPKRNRIISGLSCGVLVVEAPLKSGSLITAEHALEQGRDVFVLPGNVDNPGFAGSTLLMRDGGTPITRGWEVLGEYQLQFPDKVREDPEQSGRKGTSGGLGNGHWACAKVAQTPSIPASSANKKEKSRKKVVDNDLQPTYSDVNKELPELTGEQRAILNALSRGERVVDDVIAEVGLPAHKVSAALTMLTIRGLVRKLPGNRIGLK